MNQPGWPEPADAAARPEATAGADGPAGPGATAGADGPAGPGATVAPGSARTPGDEPPATPKVPFRRRGRLIATLVLGVMVLLCAGGGFGAYVITLNLEPHGQSTPARAVDGFLRSVYDSKDAEQAANYVCRTARDPRELVKKIREVKAAERKYRSPKYTWPDPQVGQVKGSTAVVTTDVTLSTADEKVAVQHLRFTVIKQKGWFVCEVTRTP